MTIHGEGFRREDPNELDDRRRTRNPRPNGDSDKNVLCLQARFIDLPQ